MRQPIVVERPETGRESLALPAIAEIGDRASSVLTEVARALEVAAGPSKPARGKASAATRSRPRQRSGPPPLPNVAADLPKPPSELPGASPATSPHVLHETDALPLVLTNRPDRDPAEKAASPADRTPRQLAAPALLLLALAAVATVLAAPVPEIARGLGLAFLVEPAKPRLARLSNEGVDIVVSAFSPIATTEAVAGSSLQDQLLLERCEALIAKGAVKAAREDLARAASAGSRTARFALAETYDPNVLAAWGLRENVGDPGKARALYQAALDGGDTRAVTRIDALTPASD